MSTVTTLSKKKRKEKKISSLVEECLRLVCMLYTLGISCLDIFSCVQKMTEAKIRKIERRKFEWYNWTREAWHEHGRKTFFSFCYSTFLFSSFLHPTAQHNNVIFTFFFHKNKIIRIFCWRWVNTLEVTQYRNRERERKVYSEGLGGGREKNKLMAKKFISKKKRVKFSHLYIYSMPINTESYDSFYFPLSWLFMMHKLNHSRRMSRVRRLKIKFYCF